MSSGTHSNYQSILLILLSNKFKKPRIVKYAKGSVVDDIVTDVNKAFGFSYGWGNGLI